MIKQILIFLLAIYSFGVYSQTNNLCNGADPFCTGTTYNFPATTNVTTSQTGPNYGCLGSQPNPAWYYMQVANSGNITIYMSSVPQVDIDFALWGPFTSPTGPCTAQLTAACGTGCQTNVFASPGYYPQGNLTDCSYSSNWNETATIPNAITGEYYILLITNFSNQPCNIIFNQTAGPGTTNCGIMAPPISNNGPLCVGDTLMITNNQPYPGGIYSWTGPNGFTSSQINPVIPNVTMATAGVYSMTVTVGTQTSPVVTDTVVINPLPTPTASNNGPLCLDATLNLTASGGTSYSWTGPNGFTSSIQNPSVTNILPLTGGTYNVTVTDANTCTNITSTALLINPTPTVSASNSGPECFGDSLNLSATGGVSYSWSGPANFTSNIQNPVILNTTTNNTGTYTVTVTDANGCTNVTTTIAVVNPLPIPTATNNSPVCDGSVLQLFGGGGASYVWTGPNGFVSSAQNPVISIASVNSAGTYNVTVTSSNSCVSTTSTSVVVNALPTPIPSNNSPICSGDSLKLNVTGATGTYLWSGPGGFSSTEQNPNIVQATTVYTGTYNVSITDTNSCTMISTTNVIVNIITPSIGNNSPVCTNTVLNIYASGGILYNWTGPSGFVSAQSNVIMNLPTTANSGFYTVTITDVNGCVAQMTTPVIVNPLPYPIATNNTPICSGETLNITCGGGASYLWSGPSSFASTIQNPILTSVHVSNGGIYNVTVTDSHGCTNITSTNAIINPLPIPAASNNTPVCSGEIVNLSSTGGTSYIWGCSENGYMSPIQNPSINNSAISDSGYYTVTVTLNGCTSTATTRVIVNSHPNATASNNGPICYGFPLKFTSTGGVSYTWHSSNGFISTSPQPIINNATDAASGIYNVTVTDANGCSSTAATTATVSTKVNVITMDVTICSGTSVTISAYAIGGTPPYKYYWEGYLTQSQVLVTPTVNTAYSVQVIDTNGCISNTSTLHVNVIPLVDLHIWSNKDTVCPGEGVPININPTNGTGGPYTLTLKDGTIITSPYTTYPDGINELIIFAKDACNSVDSDTIKIHLYKSPPLSFAPEQISGCIPLSIHFNETSADIGQTYQWDFGDAGSNSSSFIQSPTHTFEYAGNFDIRLSVTSKDGCHVSYTYPQLITAYPVPNSNFISDKRGASLINGSINFTNITDIICRSYWSFGDNDSSDQRNPNHIYDSIGVFEVQLVSISPHGCIDTATGKIVITDEFTIYAPTAFTPDFDGTNDFFYLLGNGIDTNNFKLIVFDRWGERVFETTNYDTTNPEKYGWDGTIKGTKLATVGLYTWLVIYKDNQQLEHQKSGIVNLIR